MAVNAKALRKLLNGLTMLYIHIKANPRKAYYPDVLSFFNMALLNRNKISGKTLQSLDTGIRSIDNECYTCYTGWMNRYCQENCSYDTEAAMAHINVLLAANDRMIEKLRDYKFRDASAMASAVVNYPDYILGRYEMDSKDFFTNELCSYSTDFHESYLEGFDQLFIATV